MAPPGGRRRLLGDWRVWLGLAITLIALAWTVRGIEPRAVLNAARGANPWLLLLALPPHGIGLWLRGLRWRHMTRELSPRPLPGGVHFRATAIGYLALNLLPLRLGELVRPWVLARETPITYSAALGTIVVDRLVDFAVLAIVAGAVLTLQASALPEWVQLGARALGMLGALPLVVLIALWLDRERVLGAFGWLLRPLPAVVAARIEGLLAEGASGLLALRRGRDLAAVVVYSALIWCVVLPAPVLITLLAFEPGLEPAALVRATLTTHVFIALAVAAPAAPGFFGVYHFACRESLTLFQISPAVAVAYGTLLHLGYWLTANALGLGALGRTGVRLTDLTRSGHR